jgi:hypothetical protein
METGISTSRKKTKRKINKKTNTEATIFRKSRKERRLLLLDFRYRSFPEGEKNMKEK